ncbi:hypothetical protein RF11_03755 [Thelohanellus kitauei]|uniref:Peptidase A2 domain-containing protein n=1 Tax=Thelohanellus kitauei TaxID=669202 RepID=A0A0C2J319_THEKT|nr:hypothetical protein RF11_03755 [Thelohanellus kitauei]
MGEDADFDRKLSDPINSLNLVTTPLDFKAIQRKTMSDIENSKFPRLLIPSILRGSIMRIIHRGNLGIVRAKQNPDGGRQAVTEIIFNHIRIDKSLLHWQLGQDMENGEKTLSTETSTICRSNDPEVWIGKVKSFFSGCPLDDDHKIRLFTSLLDDKNSKIIAAWNPRTLEDCIQTFKECNFKACDQFDLLAAFHQREQGEGESSHQLASRIRQQAMLVYGTTEVKELKERIVTIEVASKDTNRKSGKLGLGSRDVRCHECGRIAYIMRYCKFSKVPHNISFISSSLIVKGTTNGHLVNRVVDSGAELTLISRRFRIVLGNTMTMRRADKQLINATGQAIPVIGSALLCFEINNARIYHETSIVEDLFRNCIIGIDFLKANKMILNFAK